MLVRTIGVFGSAIGTMISIVVGNIIITNYFYNKKIMLDVKSFFVSIFKNLVPALIISSIISKYIIEISIDASATSWFTFLVSGIIFSFIYLLVVYTIGFDKNERVLLKQLVLRK